MNAQNILLLKQGGGAKVIPRGRDQSPMIAQSERHSEVADHYSRGGLVAAIREGLARMVKNESSVTADDLAVLSNFPTTYAARVGVSQTI